MRMNKEIARKEYQQFLQEENELQERMRKIVKAYASGEWVRSEAIHQGCSIYDIIYNEVKYDGFFLESQEQVRKILEARV